MFGRTFTATTRRPLGKSPGQERSAAFAASIFVLLGCGLAQAAGPWRANGENTRGWQLMSPEERIEHQAKVRGFTRYEDCRAYQIEHHRLMTERAAQAGLELTEGGRDFCGHLRSPSEDRK